jgi:hypothetical protein
MTDHVYPAEQILETHAATDQRWSVHPKVEELKHLAKSAGLWNLWLPRDSGALIKIKVRLVYFNSFNSRTGNSTDGVFWLTLTGC